MVSSVIIMTFSQLTGANCTCSCMLWCGVQLLMVTCVLQTNLCKLSANFAQPIGGCLKALKEGMGTTDADIACCVAEWLALHINNHDFIWSWHRWEGVLDLPVYDPTRYRSHACNTCL